MADQLFPTLVEQPLSQVQWHTLLRQHPLYSQRRYRYHTRLLAYGYLEFAPSLLTFQQITGRSSDRFNTTALTSLQQLMAAPLAKAAITLWSSITDQPYMPTQVSDDVANLPDLCAIISNNVSILKEQKKMLRSSIRSNTPEWLGIIRSLSVLIPKFRPK
jgi:hypothetical protein